MRFSQLQLECKGGNKMVESIVDVLVKRDGISREEAEELKNEARESMMEAIEDGDFELAEESMSMLGLEPDYLMELFV